MGLFFPSDPVIHGQRATGLPRYQELLERDWKSFLFADFVTLGLCIPYGLGVGYALLSSSLLVLIPVCVVGGLLVGPAISCMIDALFRSYRDAPRGWWENYCKGMKQNIPSARCGVQSGTWHRAVFRHGAVLRGASARYRNHGCFSGRAADSAHGVYRFLAAGGAV